MGSTDQQKVNIRINERDLIKLVLEFLENRQIHITQVMLERETGVINGAFSDDLLFLRQLILDGQWDSALEFVVPLKEIDGFSIRKFRFLVYKYKYLELLCIKQEAGPLQNNEFAVEEIVQCLKQIENFCDNADEFRKLCSLLTLPKLSENVRFRTWNPDSARLECFHAIVPLVAGFIDGINPNKESSEIQEHSVGDRLVQLVVKGLLYESAISFCQQQAIKGREATHKLPKLLTTQNDKLSSADLSLLSWLEVLGNEQFTIPFHQKELDFQLDFHKKPLLEAQWSEQLLSTPIKPGGKFPYSLVPRSKPKLMNKMMSYSMTTSMAFDTAVKGKCNESRSVQTMSQSTLPFLDVFSIQNQPEIDMSEELMKQSQIISGMLSESVPSALPPFASHPFLKNQTSATNMNYSSLGTSISQIYSPASCSVQATPCQQLEELCRRNQLKLSEDMNSTLPPVLEVTTPGEVDATRTNFIPPTEYPQMVQSRLFQEFHEKQQQKQIQTIHPARIPVISDPQLISNNQKAIAYQHNKVMMRPQLSAMNSNCFPPMSSRPTSMTIPSTLPMMLSQQNICGQRSCYQTLVSHPREANTYEYDYKQNDLPASGICERKNSIDDVEIELTNRICDSDEPTIPLRFVPVCCYKDTQAIRAVAFHPSGGYFAIGTNSKKLLLCRYPLDEIQQTEMDYSNGIAPTPDILFNKEKHHRGSVYCATFNQSGDLLATGSNDKTMRLLAVRLEADRCHIGADMELQHVHDGTVREIIFIEDCSSVVSSNIMISGGAGNCRLCVTNCETGQTLRTYREHTGHILGLYNWGSPTSFVSCSQDKTIRFWDLRASHSTSMICPDTHSSISCVTSVCIDPNGKLLVSGHEDASIVLYDISGGRTVQIFRPHGDEVRTVRFSNAAYYLLSGSYDKRIVITDMRGNLAEHLPYLPVSEHKDKVIQCRWHPRDFVFISTSADKSAILWSLPSLKN